MAWVLTKPGPVGLQHCASSISGYNASDRPGASRLCLQVRGHGFVLLAEDAMLVVLNIFGLERLVRVDLQDPQDLQVYRAYKVNKVKEVWA